ncbi:uncharacterized protein Z519_08479 [Cladophialophora bantiana CBS 173.52]|uniref:Thioesterase domain-containing protein n=1 Tax=Cladophialophora bantiana (strain ATCC 10958 / CBS 173.52 / CDC B-1940 / NIH 8579) TaxID=1442370 RepID=A0A0D2EL00_CLAB1|nr:uncharacterized protein Z519_08479 [Cladophialophora bantiana CBS 173.52]KIW90696.1 hypothetical protein Z519_08479 [Cladophialophora bantiana CBS 173.52]
MPAIAMPSLSSLLSWRTLAVLFALVNLKSLPLAWHARLFYRMFTNWYTHARVQRSLKWQSGSSLSVHPLFQPVSIFTRSPLLETDYNLHKSNSTYFVDLDESRTVLMTKLLVPGLKQGNKDLEREGHRGPLSVILGSVHTSFHKEIKPYERYEVRSRILAWDNKWIVVGSWFVRPASRRGQHEVLLASALSKYVVKKGKFTVSPERCFVAAGWLPRRPANCNVGADQQDKPGTRESSSEESVPPTTPPQGLPPTDTENLTITTTANPSSEPSLIPTPQEGPFAAPVPASKTLQNADIIVAKLETAAAMTGAATISSSSEPLASLTARAGESEWSWHRIEMERIRGLQVAQNWLSLDKELMHEFVKG